MFKISSQRLNGSSETEEQMISMSGEIEEPKCIWLKGFIGVVLLSWFRMHRLVQVLFAFMTQNGVLRGCGPTWVSSGGARHDIISKFYYFISSKSKTKNEKTVQEFKKK